MTRLHAARAGETPEVFSLDAQTARDTTRKTSEPNDDRLTTEPEPQRIRGTSQDFEQFSNGDVKIEMNRLRKDGGPENADAWQALERVDDRTRCASWEGACRSSAKRRHSAQRVTGAVAFRRVKDVGPVWRDRSGSGCRGRAADERSADPFRPAHQAQ